MDNQNLIILVLFLFVAYKLLNPNINENMEEYWQEFDDNVEWERENR